jgi:hypothetical protein
MTTKITVFWWYSLVYCHQCFGGTCCLHTLVTQPTARQLPSSCRHCLPLAITRGWVWPWPKMDMVLMTRCDVGVTAVAPMLTTCCCWSCCFSCCWSWAIAAACCNMRYHSLTITQMLLFCILSTYINPRTRHPIPRPVLAPGHSVRTACSGRTSWFLLSCRCFTLYGKVSKYYYSETSIHRFRRGSEK